MEDADWRGTSDTETLLVAYARWGQNVVDHIHGMFAFAIYDAARHELFLARDRFGQKPLYYKANGGDVRAASETKVLLNGSRTVTPAAISAYLQWGACPEGTLLHGDIQVLPAGHAMTIAAGGEIKTWPVRVGCRQII